MTSVGFTFISIATGKYTDYLLASIESYRNLRIETPIQWVILSDNVSKLRSELIDDESLRFTVVEIEALGWPDATLLRYQLISSIELLIDGEVIVYFDADMRFVNIPTFLEFNWKSSAPLYFTAHPGYYVEGFHSFVSLAYRAPKTFLKFFKVWLVEGGLGTWEKRKSSSAFVKRRQRTRYFCGGVWFGDRLNILNMCKQLSERTQMDSSKGIVARFHDESHLNWYATTVKDFIVLPPENCFAEGYANLRNISARVVAIEKENSHF